MVAGHLPELIIALMLAVLIFGPKRLPEIGRSVGRGISNFRRETEALRDEAASIKDEIMSVEDAVHNPPSGAGSTDLRVQGSRGTG